ncbi:hypothetical protein GCM10010319_23310 [Streptomyces blastmyceticus]|uniref:Uncharacterized protein n=1 Tax=Streptomyces blastmyceticus TaxID=68180 RepID=A0ABP3GI80_9ACTN
MLPIRYLLTAAHVLLTLSTPEQDEGLSLERLREKLHTARAAAVTIARLCRALPPCQLPLGSADRPAVVRAAWPDGVGGPTQQGHPPRCPHRRRLAGRCRGSDSWTRTW